MQRLTPENPKVVWVSGPVRERSKGKGPGAPAMDFGSFDMPSIRMPFEPWVIHADEFPPGTRIRITAEVLAPETEAEHE